MQFSQQPIPASQKTTAEDEVKKFGLLSSEWWNQAGDFDVLKAMNKLRIPWIKNTLLKDSETKLIKPLDSFKILDVGCGGGLLSEVEVCQHSIVLTLSFSSVLCHSCDWGNNFFCMLNMIF